MLPLLGVQYLLHVGCCTGPVFALMQYTLCNTRILNVVLNPTLEISWGKQTFPITKGRNSLLGVNIRMNILTKIDQSHYRIFLGCRYIFLTFPITIILISLMVYFFVNFELISEQCKIVHGDMRAK